MDVLETMLANWIMALITAISGASLFFALDKGSAGRFVCEKTLRLRAAAEHPALRPAFSGSCGDPHGDALWLAAGHRRTVPRHSAQRNRQSALGLVVLKLGAGHPGFGRKYLDVYKPLLAYANEAALPFYILHHPVLLSVGFLVVRWAVPVAVKFAVIDVLSFVLILGLYEFLVRRANVQRVLFGTKPKGKRAPAQPSEALLRT